MDIGTGIVMPEDERPNRRDGTCFYCSQKIGDPHETGCVILRRTVVVRVTVDVVLAEPRDHDKGLIEFHYNDGSWCSDNMFDAMGRWAAQERGEGECVCSCAVMRVEFVREATEDDHAELPCLFEKTQ